jgi:hypothetical protein
VEIVEVDFIGGVPHLHYLSQFAAQVVLLFQY